MSRITPRAKVPKTADAGEVIDVKVLITHPMHSGHLKDADGNRIPRKIINTFTAFFEGEEIFSMNLEPAISTNPFITFPFRAVKSGAFRFVWIEDGGAEYTLERKLTVG